MLYCLSQKVTEIQKIQKNSKKSAPCNVTKDTDMHFVSLIFCRGL